MFEKYNAVVLRGVNWRESDMMLTLFTLEGGICSACLRGAKKAGAKLAFAGEPFSFCEFVLSVKDGRRTVKEAAQIDGFYNIRMDIDRFTAASSVCEFAYAFLPEGVESYDLFLAVVTALRLLSEGRIDPKRLLAAFYVKALGYVGYQLDFEKCSRCNRELEGRVFFDFGGGAAVCADCAGPLDTEFRFSTYSFLKKCASIQLGDAEKYPFMTDESDPREVTGALKFLDFAFKQNAGVTIRSHKPFIS